MRSARRSPSLGAFGLAAARLRAHGGLVGGIALTIAVSIALLCALSAWTAWQTSEALRAGLAGSGGDAAWMQVQTRPADDLAGQDAAARAVFEEVFGDSVTVEALEVGAPGDDGYRVAWRLTPVESGIDAVSVERLGAAVERLPDEFRDSPAELGGSQFSGELAPLLDVLVVGAAASRAIAPVPLALLGILAWFAVFELARLLGASRGRETALLGARGLSAGQGRALALGEAVVLAVTAGVVGAALALGALALFAGSASLGLVGATWPIALGAIVLFTVTIAVASARAAASAATASAGAGRVAAAASSAVAVLILLAAVVLVWQLRATADAPAGAEWRTALVALAPTFAVAAVAVASVLLVPPLATFVAGRVVRRRGLALPARQVARRAVGYSVAVALAAITAAGATLAAGYVGTWQSGSATAAALAAGAPLRADVPAGDMSAELIAGAAAVGGVDAIGPVVTAPVEFGETAASFVAVPSDQIESLVVPVAGIVDPTALADTLAVATTGAVTFDPGATGIRVTAHSTAHAAFEGDPAVAPEEAERVYFRAWLVDAAQVPALIELQMTATPDATGAVVVGVGELPPGTAPWSLIGIDAGIRATSPFTQALVTDVAAEQLMDAASSPMAVSPVNVALYGNKSVPQALLWTAATVAPDRIPGVITTELAATIDVAVGDDLDAGFAGSGRVVPVSVVEIVDAVPGTVDPFAVMVALECVWTTGLTPSQGGSIPSLLPPNEAWAEGSVAPDELSAALGGAAVSEPSDSAAALTASLVLVWGIAAIGGAVLAGIALTAVFAALTSQRSGEVLVLRAIGLSPRAQSRLRTVEAVAVCACAAVLGAAGGLVVAFAVVPPLVAAAVPALPASLGVFTIAPWPLVAAVACLTGSLVVVAVSISVAVARQGRSTRLEEAAA